MSGIASAGLGALQGLLHGASFRGVSFGMLDSTDEVGRRLVSFMFPGVDAKLFEDLGPEDGKLHVGGIIIGDDYILRTTRMRAALRAGGPATLVHPWLGPIQVMLAELAPIRFADAEQRCARFEATFERWLPVKPPAADSLAGVLLWADGLVDAVQVQLQSVLSVLALPLAFVGLVNGVMGSIGGLYDALIGGPGNSAFRDAAAPGLAGLAAGVTLDPAASPADYAAAITGVLLAVPSAIGASAVADDAPAVASSGTLADPDAVDTPAPDPRDAASVLLAAAAAVRTDPLGGAAAAARLPVALAAGAVILAQAAASAASIAFESRQEAIAWRGRVDAALAVLAGDAAALAAAQPAGAGAVWQAVRALRSAVAADINAQIGRLPAVTTLVTPSTMSAWLVALHVAGDDPGSMVAAYQDLVARNGVFHPALVPAGTLEVLVA